MAAATVHDGLFDLNIEVVLENWPQSNAVREFIANALDESLLSRTATNKRDRDGGPSAGAAPRDIEVSCSAGVWTVRDYGRGLQPHHLTQNENTEKLNATEGVIGRFGFGLKDAVAVLHRSGVAVTITSRHMHLHIVMAPKEGFPDIKTLHAKLSASPDPMMAGTAVELAGVEEGAVEKAKAMFFRFSSDLVIATTQYGTVLRKVGADANIYIRGILVAKDPNLVFSYNITNLTKEMVKGLNRERTNVGRVAFKPRIENILLEASSREVHETLVRELENLHSGDGSARQNHDEIGWRKVMERATMLRTDAARSAAEQVAAATAAAKLAEEATRKAEEQAAKRAREEDRAREVAETAAKRAEAAEKEAARAAAQREADARNAAARTAAAEAAAAERAISAAEQSARTAAAATAAAEEAALRRRAEEEASADAARLELERAAKAAADGKASAAAQAAAKAARDASVAAARRTEAVADAAKPAAAPLPKPVFVTEQELKECPDIMDQVRRSGRALVQVPDACASSLQGMKDSKGKAMPVSGVFVSEFSASVTQTFVDEKELTESEREMLHSWHTLAELTGGMPKVVKSVVVAESLVPAGDDFSPVGMWVPSKGQVIIKRSQLRNQKQFAGTLLHELTHARSGRPDVNRDFEVALTSLVGDLADQLLNAKGGR